MTLDQQIRDFNKKLKGGDLMLEEWYNYDTKAFTFSIWTRETEFCSHTSKSTSRREAFNRLVARFNKEER